MGCDRHALFDDGMIEDSLVGCSLLAIDFAAVGSYLVRYCSAWMMICCCIKGRVLIRDIHPSHSYERWAPDLYRARTNVNVLPVYGSTIYMYWQELSLANLL